MDRRRVLSWLPSDCIDFAVLSGDLQLYLGPDAIAEKGHRRKDVRPGSYVSAYATLTVSMISDLKRDSIDWKEEHSRSGKGHYGLSTTRAQCVLV